MPKHILLIDDEDDIREVTAVGLEATAGWLVSSAASGIAAIDLARKTVPDVILLDVMMPDQDGPATLRLLRQDEVVHERVVHVCDARRRTTGYGKGPDFAPA